MAQVLMVVLALSSSSPSASSSVVSPGDSVGILHPLAVIGEGPVVAEGMETVALSPMDAARTAAGLLGEMGATDVLVCEVMRIEAPLTAYVVDAVGALSMNGGEFDAFRLVLRDGAEYDGELYPPAEQIAFIARGIDQSGQAVWYPSCGPDYVPEGDEPAFADSMFEFEFLIGRESFETLSQRYPAGSSDQDPGSLD